MTDSFMVSAIELLKTNFIYAAIGFIILFTLYWYIRYDAGILGSITASLKKINKNLYTIGGYEIENIARIDDMFDENSNPVVKEAWADYFDDFRNVMSREKSPDIRDYFNPGNIITIPAARRKVEAVPGIITVLGILGTFSGILLNLSGSISDGTGIQVVSDRLLSGSAAAFMISIAALALSVLFQLLDRQLYHKAVKELHLFCSMVENRVPVSSNLQYFDSLTREQKRQMEYIKKLGDNIASKLNAFIGEDLVPSINKTFEESIKTYLAPSIENISRMLFQISQITIQSQKEGMQRMVDSFIKQLNTQVGRQYGGLEKAVGDLTEFQKRTGENLDSLVAELAKNTVNHIEINKATESVIKTIDMYHKDITESSSALAEILEKINHFTGSLAEIMDANREALEKLTEERTALKQESDDFLDRVNMRMLQAREDLNNETEALISRFTAITSDTIDRLENNINSALDGLNANARTMLENMDDQVRSMGYYSRELAENIGQLNDRLENSLKEFADHLHNGVVKTFGDFDEGLGEICTRFGRTISDIRDSIDSLPIVVGTLRDEIASTEESKE